MQTGRSMIDREFEEQAEAQTIRKIAKDWEKDNLNNEEPVYGWSWGGSAVIAEVMGAVGHLFRGKHVLEIGCGGGRWTQVLFDAGGASHVTAMDVHEPAIRRSMMQEARATYILGDGQNLPSGKFDVIFSWDVFLHLPPGQVLRYLIQARRQCQMMIFALPDVGLTYGRDLLKSMMDHDPYTLGYINVYAEEYVKAMSDIAEFKHFHRVAFILDRETLFVLES